jgi:putative FmdB family regulatory protein
MPTYEYVCDECGEHDEVFQRISSEPLTICQHCQTPNLRRLIGAGSAIIFKGSGFYETDYRSKKKEPKKENPLPAATPESSSDPAPKKDDYGSRD